MAEPGHDSELVGRLFEEFLERRRRGERPTIEEYEARHPALGGDFRELAEAAAILRGLAAAPGDTGGVPAAMTHPFPGGRVLDRVGDYRLIREVGRGGMGVVYEAEQESLGRRVALKVLPHRVAAIGNAAGRFRNEARAAARLHHTNIVPVFEVGCEGEVHYYAMQFIGGRGLDAVIRELRRLRGRGEAATTIDDGAPADDEPERLARSLMTGRFRTADLGCDADPNEQAAGPESPTGLHVADPDASSRRPGRRRGNGRATSSSASPPESHPSSLESDGRRFFRNVAGIGRQVAEALAFAHSRGIIHRDVKPSNLLLDAGGVVWITDFGLAKTDDEGLTHSGDILGTLRYMGPERFRGACDPRSDVYSLGLTLYEMLVLRPAFACSDRLELIERVTREEPASPRSLDPRVPRDLETIVLKAIDKDPQRRYGSAADLAEDLRRFVADEPIRARRPGVLGVARRWCRRKPAVAALSALVALLVAATTVGSVVAAYRLNRLAGSEGRAHREADRRAAEAREVVDYLVNDMLAASMPERTQGRSVTVDELLKRADERIEGRFAGHPTMEASIRHTMGVAYRRLGRYDRARHHLSRAIELRAGALGAAHPDSITTVCEQAGVLEDQGLWKQAVELLEWALAARLRFSDEDDAEALRLRHELGSATIGSTLWSRGGGDWKELERARAMLEGVVAARRRRLGHEHPETLASLDQLARVLTFRGRLAEGEALYKGVIEARRRVLGVEHRETLRSMAGLAEALRSQERWAEARVLNGRVVDGRRRTLGPEHPETLEAMSLQAKILRDDGAPEDAKRVYQEAIALMSRVLGADHRTTLVARSDFAGVSLRQLNYREARGRLEQVLPAQRRTLGPGHPDTMSTSTDLAWALAELGEYAAAKSLQEEILAQYRRTQGDEHNDTLWTMFSLANLHRRMNELSLARELHERVLTIRRRTLGPGHRETVFSMNALANVLRDQGRRAEARVLNEQVLEDRLREHGDDHAATWMAMGWLAWSLATAPIPGSEDRDIRRAMELAEAIVKADPSNRDHHNTLGVARYRAGDWRGAIASLEKAIELGEDRLAWIGYFLAMGRWRSGDLDAARRTFLEVARWQDQHASSDPEYGRFRAEAAALLGMPDRPASQGIEASPEPWAGPAAGSASRLHISRIPARVLGIEDDPGDNPDGEVGGDDDARGSRSWVR